MNVIIDSISVCLELGNTVHAELVDQMKRQAQEMLKEKEHELWLEFDVIRTDAVTSVQLDAEREKEKALHKQQKQHDRSINVRKFVDLPFLPP